jgi:hypothetical protein
MQPLSLVRKNARVSFGQNDLMSSRPKVAIRIAECIAEWANIEATLAMFLGLLLEADGKTALAMYHSLENRAAQLRMLHAAFEARLSVEDYDIFFVLMEAFLRPHMRTRDKLAHWCWGCCVELPNDLLLMEPDEKTSMHFAALHAPIQFDHNKIYVVTEKYLAEFLRDLRKAFSYLATFLPTAAKMPPSFPLSRAKVRQTLSSVPEIQRAVARRRASREKPQAAPPLLPEEWHVEKP